MKNSLVASWLRTLRDWKLPGEVLEATKELSTSRQVCKVTFETRDGKTYRFAGDVFSVSNTMLGKLLRVRMAGVARPYKRGALHGPAKVMKDWFVEFRKISYYNTVWGRWVSLSKKEWIKQAKQWESVEDSVKPKGSVDHLD